MDFSNINWLAVAVATIASFAVGFLWYGPVFGKLWQKHIGLSDDDIKNANMLMIFGPAFILTLIMAIVLSMMTAGGWKNGMNTGALIGFGFVATAIGVNYLFARKSLTLFFIDAGYSAIVLMLMGAIIGAWQ